MSATLPTSSDVDPTNAPAGYFARLQTLRERYPLGPSCTGCAFEDEPADASGLRCKGRPCSRFGRPDGRAVVFQKLP